MSATAPLPVLVVGGGIAGITAALEAAEAGQDVILLEREGWLGGRVAAMHRYFPKLCPPSCGLEINFKRLERNPRVRVITGARVATSRPLGSGREVTVKIAPRYVNDRCTACAKCSEVCPGKAASSVDYGLAEAPAIRLPHPYAWPKTFVLDRSACPSGCAACVQACAYQAIDLNAKETSETLQVASVVLATGWTPYPLEKLPELGGGLFPDVISNVQLERLAAASGPTGGKIQRRSDGQAPKRVAFVQCAGSRDVKHLPYCSAVCCLASMKQALYVKEQLPDADVTIFYIDRRTPGRNEEMLRRVAETAGVRFVKGKVGKVEAAGGALKLRAEDVDAGRITETEADLVVLATGMAPSLDGDGAALGAVRDDDGFGVDDLSSGVVFAGTARRPADVAGCTRDATGAAAKAIAAAGTFRGKAKPAVGEPALAGQGRA